MDIEYLSKPHTKGQKTPQCLCLTAWHNANEWVLLDYWSFARYPTCESSGRIRSTIAKARGKTSKKLKFLKWSWVSPLQIGCIGNLGGDSISPWRHQSIGESQLFLGIIFPNIYSEGWYLFSTFVESRLFNRLPDLHVSARAALFDSSRFRIASITWHPLWLAITSTILLVLRQLDDMHNTILPFDCWLWSRLFYRVKG